MARMKLNFGLLVLQLCSPTIADLLGDDFLRWFWQSSVIDQTNLYIAGGELYTLNESASGTVDQLWEVNYDHGVHVIDISQAWNVTTVTQTDTATQDENLKLRRPTFWNDPINKSVNVYGGWPYIFDPNFVSYTSSWPDNSGVNLKAHARFGNDGGIGFPFVRKMGGLVTTSSTSYYNLGGFGTSNTDPEFEGLPIDFYFTESGLLEFDYANQTWTNHTTTFSRVHGEAQFIPIFGELGVIAFIGGDKPTTQQYTTTASLVDMTTVTIYDIKTQQYYDQSTTGDTPIPRGIFCSVGVSGPSNDTFEIFVFGGLPGTIDANSTADMGNVYILSLPSFTWTSTNTTSSWRYANHCTVIGKSHMLNIGGVGANFTEKDDLPGGLGIFNLNTLAWQNNYNPEAAAYTPPSVISALYNSKGQPKTPVTFSNPTLKGIFQSATSSTSSSSSTGSSSNPTASSTPHSTAIGAIAGGVVGGVALLAALGFLAWFLLRRRRNATPHGYASAAEIGSSDNGEYHGMAQIVGGEMGAGNVNRPVEMETPQGAGRGPQWEQEHGEGEGRYGKQIQYESYRNRPKMGPGGQEQVREVHELS